MTNFYMVGIEEKKFTKEQVIPAIERAKNKIAEYLNKTYENMPMEELFDRKFSTYFEPDLFEELDGYIQYILNTIAQECEYNFCGIELMTALPATMIFDSLGDEWFKQSNLEEIADGEF